MPTYEYGCAACGNEWEEIQRISEPPLEVCPKCAKSAAHRLISAGTGFILKGGGWYSDLYSSAKPSAKKDEGGAGAPTESASKAEKPAASSTSESSSSPSPAAGTGTTKPAAAA
jgi:putative FmdB family regulatory protein